MSALPHLKSEVPPSDTSFANRRILIVDDSPAIHADFRKILCSRGKRSAALDEFERELFDENHSDETPSAKVDYDISVASQGEQALAMVEQAVKEGRPYAVVFMDVRMPPGMDGVETIKRIWEKAPGTEAVLCTAYMDYSHEELRKQLGASDRLLFLKKPFDPTAVSQMALMMTAKWNLEQQIHAHIHGLEDEVSTKEQLLVENGKFATLGLVAGGIAHEINTPLSTVMMLAQLLGEKAENGTVTLPEVAGIAARIQKASKRIAGIVRGVGTIAAGDSNREETAEFEVADVVSETLMFCHERYVKQGVPLECGEVPAGLRALGRPVGLSQVLLNLLNNAFDAVDAVPEKWIEIQLEVLDHEFRIAVIDSGHGIRPELREKILQPFFTTKEIGKGTGLGLSVAKGLVESHNGSLLLDTTSKHTRFVIVLPRIAA